MTAAERRRDARREMFKRFLASSTPEAAVEFLWEHTALLAPFVLEDLKGWAATERGPDAVSLRRGAEDLQGVAGALTASYGGWPAAGPLEQLAARVQRGDVTPAQAAATAAAPAMADALSPLYAEVCARRAERQAIRGDPPSAVRVFKLLFAGLDTLLDEEGWTFSRASATIDWITTASVACNALPDGRWFADAVRRGEALLATGAPAAPAPVAGDLLHALGVLHLDTYIAGRTSSDLEGQLRAWRERLSAVYGVAAARDPACALPEMAEALPLSAGYFRRALPLRKGQLRGFTLKALAEALVWREIIGGPAERAEAQAAATEALALIPEAAEPQRVAALQGLLAFVRAPAEAGGAKVDWAGLATRNASEWIEELGETAALERYGLALRADDVPWETKLKLAGAVWPFLSDPQHDEAKQRFALALGEAAFAEAKAAGVVGAQTEPLAARADALAAAADKEGWPAARTAGLMLGLAVSTSAANQEAQGLSIAQEAVRRVAEEPFADALAIVEASLAVGAAVNAHNAGDAASSALHYSYAVGRFANLGMSGQAMEMVLRLEDVAFAGTDAEITDLILSLAFYGPMMERYDLPGVTERLQNLWRRLFGRVVAKGRGKLEILVLLHQAAKGETFALTATSGQADGWRDDLRMQELLREIDRLRSLGDVVGTPDLQLDDEEVLCAFASRVATEAAGLPAAVARLEQSFDDRLRALSAATAEAGAILTWPEELQASLGPSTVLLTHYLGTMESGRTGLFSLLLSAEEAHAAVGEMDYPGGVVVMTGADRTLRIHPQGMAVARLRRSVVEDPGPADVGSDADDELVRDLDLLGGGLKEVLRRLSAAGKDHLCIHPCGAYHFHPLHLIGGSAGCLADDWTVSTLPHPVLLRRARVAPRPPKLCAFALSFADGAPHGLAPLPAAVDEASAVVKLMGGQLFSDAAAMEGTFVAALMAATHVHVASHGSQCVGAASFQRLYLAPDMGNDGVFHAYEVLGLDLRHVELVTLSACETALGRFDAGDNLRGLAANLLASGVGAIVSTLWPIADEVSHDFFVALYEGIAKGQPRLAAFRVAQVATRARYPAFRDWGAFQYSGSW